MIDFAADLAFAGEALSECPKSETAATDLGGTKNSLVAAGTPQGLAVGFVVGSDGNGQNSAVIRVEQKYKAIRPIEAHRIEVVARIELLVPSSAGEVAGEQLVDHRLQFAFHVLGEPLCTLSERAAGLAKLANWSGFLIRQAPPPWKLRT